MATYSPSQISIKAPSGGFQQGGWYNGRQYWNGTLSDPGVIHPESNQVGAGQAVSAEVNAQSAAQQGDSSGQFNKYLQQQGNSTPQTTNTYTGISSTPNIPASLLNTSAVSAPTTSIPNIPAIDLNSLYQDLYNKSGIATVQADLNDKEKKYIEAKAQTNDNPFLSEATRVGRIAKLDQLYQDRTANLRNELAQKQANLETLMNLQTKQYEYARDAAYNQYEAGLKNYELQNNLVKESQEKVIDTFTDVSGQRVSVLINPATGETRSVVTGQADLGPSGYGGILGGSYGTIPTASDWVIESNDVQTDTRTSGNFQNILNGAKYPQGIITKQDISSLWGE